MRLLLALLVALLPATARAQTIDYNVADGTFPVVRADINAHLTAIRSSNAGVSAPATTFAYLPWIDLSGAAPVLRYRNAANSGWAAAFRIDPTTTVWLGGLETASATITGGTINGTAIGQTTPSAGTFTNIAGAFARISTAAASAIDLTATNVADTHETTRIVRSTTGLLFQTNSAGGSTVATDYVLTPGTTGAVTHLFRTNNEDRVFIGSGGVTVNGNVSPIGSRGLGDIGARWNSIFLVNAPNVSSDARLKVDVAEVAEAECRAADRIEIKRYRLAADPEGPLHFGVMAQDVIAAFEAEGLDWRNYAIVTGSEAETYGVAYDELQSLKLACL